MSGLADKLEALRAAGFSEADMRGYAATRRQALSDAGFRQDEIDAALGVRRPEMNEAKKAVARANSMLERQIAEQKEQAASLKRGAADIAAGITGGAETPSLWEYLDFGYQHSVTGLIARGRAPEARPPRLPEGREPGYFGHLATQAGTLAGDIPAMIAGGLAGGPAGVAVAGPPGAVAGAFGGAFALPAMLRRGLMDEYEKGTITSFEEYWDRVLAIAVDGLKGFATGAATGHAGALAKPGLERLAKEVVTMTTVGQALEGEIPKPRDFVDAFILIVGFKGTAKVVESGARKLRNLYAETGATPADVAADARLDPTIAEDLVSKNIAIPRAYRDRVEPPGEPKPEPARGPEGPAAAGEIAPPPGPPPPAGPKQIPGPGEPLRLPPPSDAVATVLSRAVIGHKPPRKWLDFHRLYTDWVNDQHPLSLAFAAMVGKGKGVAPSENFVTQARLFRGAMGKPEHFLEISPFKFGTFANVGKSFKAIVRPVFDAGDQNNLRAYLMAKHALDYERRGLESGIDLPAARRVIAELARLEPVARELAEYQDHVLNYLQDAGVLSAEMAARFRQANRDYVPFHRLTEDQLAGVLTAKGMQARNPLRRVTGSERAIIDPLESIVKNTYALIMAAEQNNVARSYVDFAAKHGSEWAQKSAVKVRPIYVTPGEIAKIIKTFATVTRRGRKTVSETEETRTIGGGGEAGKPVAKVRATAEEALTARGFSAAEASQILDRIAAAEGAGQTTIVEKTIRRVEKMEVEQELGAVLTDTGFTIFRPARRNANASEIVVWRNGKAELWEVPLEIAEVFKALNEQQAGTLLKVLATPAKVLRAGAVLAPEFIGRNPARDQLSAFVNSDALYLPFIHLGFGVKSLARAKSGAFDRDFSDWLKGGGSLATLISIDRPATQKALAKLAGETRFMDSARNVVTSPIQLLQAVSEAAEQGTRVGVFRANTPRETRVRPFAPEASARPRTKDEIQAGSLQARESSLDFRRRGTQAQAVNMLVAFWNAGVQGTDKTIRVFKDHPVRTTARVAAAITLPSVLLYLANRDDPRYRDLPQWQKDLFWIIITDDTIYRLPKPFALGVLFGSGAERVTEFILSRDPKAFDELLETFVRGAAPGVVPTAATPVIEQQANRSLFTERPIVPYATERLLPQYQYTLYTTELAKAVGAAVAAIPGMRHSQAASPAILENYVRAWTGGLGIHALKLADAGLRAAGVLPDPNLPASTWADIPFVKAFIVREPSMSAKPVNDFFNRYQRQSREMATVKALARQGDPAAALMELERSGGVFAEVEDIKLAISNGIKLTRDIAKDPTLSPDDKRQIIDQVTRQVIEMAREGNARMDATEKAKSK